MKKKHVYICPSGRRASSSHTRLVQGVTALRRESFSMCTLLDLYNCGQLGLLFFRPHSCARGYNDLFNFIPSCEICASDKFIAFGVEKKRERESKSITIVEMRTYIDKYLHDFSKVAILKNLNEKRHSGLLLAVTKKLHFYLLLRLCTVQKITSRG